MDRGDLRDAAVDGSACAIYLRSGLRLKGLSRSQQWQPLRSISTHIIASPWGNRASVAPGAHANRVVFTLQVMFFRSIPVVPPHKCILYCVLMCVIVCSCCRESQSSKIRHSAPKQQSLVSWGWLAMILHRYQLHHSPLSITTEHTLLPLLHSN